MPKLTFKCPICDKQLVLKRDYLVGSTKLNEYKCGHTFSKDMLHFDKATLDFTSADFSGKHARSYQEDGIQFILESDFNCIIGDQMRLGKTPQALLALKNKLKEKSPCLILVRSANLWQWIREYKVWTTTLPNRIFPILSTSAWIPPGFSAYIISMDTFSRPKMLQKLKKIPFKLIIADEAHSFKNTDSNRSQALTDFVTFLNTGETTLELKFTCSRCQHEWMELGSQKFDKRIGHTVLSKSSHCPQCSQYCYVSQQHQTNEVTKDENSKAVGLVLLTGTAIKNRAEEYFVPLNLCDPEKFSSLERFRRQWLEQDTKGRWSRIKRGSLDSFKNEIKPYVLRREKEDVYIDLPPLIHNFTLIEPDKDVLAKQYNKILDKLEVKLSVKANPSYWDLAEDMMELRRIAGLMKVMWTSDYLEASLLDSDNQRFAVGIHHKAVRDVLYHKLGGSLNCLKLSGEDSSWNKDQIMRSFETSSQRVLIINMIAGGVGMDFHYCNNILMLEQNWSGADEEQFIFRFYNPDFSIKSASTNVETILCKGTIDEWWYDMLVEKKLIFNETVSNHWSFTEDPQSFKQLAERTVGARL